MKQRLLSVEERDAIVRALSEEQRVFLEERMKRGRRTQFARQMAEQKGAVIPDTASYEDIESLLNDWIYVGYIDAGHVSEEYKCECGRALRYQHTVQNKATAEVKRFGIDHLEMHTGIDAKTVQAILKGFQIIDYELSEMLSKVKEGWKLADVVRNIPPDLELPQDIAEHVRLGLPLLERQTFKLRALVREHLDRLPRPQRSASGLGGRRAGDAARSPLGVDGGRFGEARRGEFGGGSMGDGWGGNAAGEPGHAAGGWSGNASGAVGGWSGSDVRSSGGAVSGRSSGASDAGDPSGGIEQLDLFAGSADQLSFDLFADGGDQLALDLFGETSKARKPSAAAEEQGLRGGGMAADASAFYGAGFPSSAKAGEKLTERQREAVYRYLREGVRSARIICELLIRNDGASDRRFLTQKPVIYAAVCRTIDAEVAAGVYKLASKDENDRIYEQIGG